MWIPVWLVLFIIAGLVFGFKDAILLSVILFLGGLILWILFILIMGSASISYNEFGDPLSLFIAIAFGSWLGYRVYKNNQEETK